MLWPENNFCGLTLPPPEEYQLFSDCQALWKCLEWLVVYLTSPTPGTRKIANANLLLLFKGMCHRHKSPSVCAEMLRWCGRDTLEPFFMVGGLRCLMRGQASLCMPQAAGRPFCYRKSRSSLGWKGKECSLHGELVGISTRRFFKPQMTNLVDVGSVQPQYWGACLHSSPQTPASSCAQVLSVKCSRLCMWPRHITNTLSPG